MSERVAESNVDHASVSDSTTKTLVPLRKPTEPTRKPKILPPFRVLLHNDEVNTFEHVIKCILKLTTLSPEEAIERTIEAHEQGLALLLVTHKERAELYQEQFTSLSLTVSIEPAS